MPGTIGLGGGEVGVGLVGIIFQDSGLVSWRCFARLEGFLGQAEGRMCVVVMTWAITGYGALGLLKPADKYWCQRFWGFLGFVASGQLVLLQRCSCHFPQIWRLFLVVRSIFLGEAVFLVYVAVYDAGGAWSAFCSLAWVVSDFGPFASVTFHGHVWGFGRGWGPLGLLLLWVVLSAVLAWTWGNRTSQLLYLLYNLLFLDFRTSAFKPLSSFWACTTKTHILCLRFYL